MKKGLVLVIAALMLISAVSLVSAQVSVHPTLVDGTVYDIAQEGNGNFTIIGIIPNATVVVNCTHGEGVDTLLNATSDDFGRYEVVFNSSQCSQGDFLTALAFTSDGRVGGNFGNVSFTLNISGGQGGSSITLDVGVVDIFVPAVPEFGLIVGMVTVAGAIGLFFYIRKSN